MLRTTLLFLSLAWAGCGSAATTGPAMVQCPADAKPTQALREDGATRWTCQRDGVLQGPELVVQGALVLERLTYLDGRKDGPALETSADLTLEGAYRADRREGDWRVRRGATLLRVEPYVAGIKHGFQTTYLRDGGVARRQCFDGGTSWGAPLLADGGLALSSATLYGGRPASWWRSRLGLLRTKKGPEFTELLELMQRRATLAGVPLDAEDDP